MKVNRRWIQQILSHLQYRGNMASDGKNISGVDILVPENVMNILKEALPGYESMVFFDLETTGLLPEKDRMLQLSAVSIKMSVAKLLSFNTYIRLEKGMVVPQKITELTGITDEMSKQYGISEEKALLSFGQWLDAERVIMVGHNVQFDLCFLLEACRRHTETCSGVKALIDRADYLDTLTVYKDRRPSPHNLSSAVYEYHVCFKSSHHALEDAGATLALCYFMGCEKSDLHTYINRFGINPKYGLSGAEIEKVAYYIQEGIQSVHNESTEKSKGGIGSL